MGEGGGVPRNEVRRQKGIKEGPNEADQERRTGKGQSQSSGKGPGERSLLLLEGLKDRHVGRRQEDTSEATRLPEDSEGNAQFPPALWWWGRCVCGGCPVAHFFFRKWVRCCRKNAV